MNDNPIIDSILHPTLAYKIGREASQRVKDIKAGIRTVEGKFVANYDRDGYFFVPTAWLTLAQQDFQINIPNDTEMYFLRKFEQSVRKTFNVVSNCHST